MKHLTERISSDLISNLQPNEIFVFGSNESGYHGGGAAKLAMQWGAEWGNPVGLQGQTYAIPTKSEYIRRTLTVDEIKVYADIFLRFAKATPELTFLVTEIGCGLAGLTPAEIAPLFAGAYTISNILLPQRFVNVLQTKRQKFVLDTLLPYFKDPSTCATTEDGQCAYLTKDGRKCAVGKHMNPGPWQHKIEAAHSLIGNFRPEDVLTEEAYKQFLSPSSWEKIQNVHDTLAYAKDKSSDDVLKVAIARLEDNLKLNFNELRENL